MQDLSQLQIFALVGDTGSFTSAAQALGVSKAHVSKQVRALEDRLGARLLNRTTRKVALTDVGSVFHARCRRILDEVAEAESAVTDLQTTPRGTLRVSVPVSFGVAHIAPALAEFAAIHPDLHVDADFSDRRVDLLEDSFDLAIRIGTLPDSSLVARRLGQTCSYVVGSEDYLRRRGVPATPQDLRAHDCLLYSYQLSGQAWRLSGPAGEVTVPVNGRLLTNNGDAMVEAARCGVGLCFVPDFLVAEEIAKGGLRRVLEEWSGPSPIWAVYPHSRHLSTKVRLFVDHLAQRLDPAPWAALCSPPARGKGRRRS
jgi:DNA-binding transcriptional LysR family regulator